MASKRALACGEAICKRLDELFDAGLTSTNDGVTVESFLQAAELIDFHYPPPASDETRAGYKIRTFGYEVTFEADGRVNLRQEINYGEGNGVDDTTIQFSSLDEAGRAFVAAYMKVKEEIQRRG